MSSSTESKKPHISNDSLASILAPMMRLKLRLIWLAFMVFVLAVGLLFEEATVRCLLLVVWLLAVKVWIAVDKSKA